MSFTFGSRPGINSQSCVTFTDSPGAKIVKDSGLPPPIIALGAYFSRTPVNVGLVPLTLLMVNVLVGVLDNGPRGSLRILIVSSPILRKVVITLRLSTPLTLSSPASR